MVGSFVGARVLVVAAVGLAVTAMAAAPGADAGFEDGFPRLVVSMTGDTGPIKQGQTATYVATVTNQGTGTDPDAKLHLSSYRVNGDRPVQNPYREVTPSQGSCVSNNFPSKFGEYHGQECSLGPLAAGASAQVTAVVEINQSMDHNAFVGFGQGGSSTVTTLVNAPPVFSGSKKIKVSGLPDGCAASPFTLKASAKGAKKMSAALRGPLNDEGKPEDGGFSDVDGLASATGPKLKAPVKVDQLERAFYEIKLAAKYDDKPKQKAGILLQVCT